MWIMRHQHRRLTLGGILATTLLLFGCTPETAPSMRASKQAELGKILFFDSTLSVDGHVSCATCHVAAKSFTDGHPVSIGVQGRSGTRNAPGLPELRLYSELFWDGRERKLDAAVLQPLTNPKEMGNSGLSSLLNQINTKDRYKSLVQESFGVASLNEERLGIAIAAYLRSLPMPATRYDLSVTTPSLLNEEEVAGLALFRGKAACAGCHTLAGTPAALTDQLYHHTGVGFEQVAGDVAGMLKRLDDAKKQGQPIGDVVLSDADVAELGRFAVTRRPLDLGAFRTPTLRNVALTAPYMHDGSIATLREAVEREIYYRSLSRGMAINLTVREQQQLIAFLGTFTTADSQAN